jgi:formylglycine-generating enzyme required for sulfatase activity
MRLVTATLTMLAASACNNLADVQCDVSSSCDLSGGGICAMSASGNHWCAYPDSSCSGGYRYSGFQVGDGLAGVCLYQMDAGVPDAPAPDLDAGPPPPPGVSCLGKASNCGNNGDDNCCNSLLIPAGSYFRSYDLAGDSISGDTSYPATVSSFRLDKYEVTVARFRAFVEAGQGTQANHPASGVGTHPNIPNSGWQSSWNTSLQGNKNGLIAALKCDSFKSIQPWTDTPGPNENRPITCITWYEAMAFCGWDGGFLPTEAEWNYAAAGGNEQRVYPWSTPATSTTIDTADMSYATNNPSTGIPNCLGDGLPACAVTDLVNVGTKPDGNGRWGQSELAGNASEWVLDTYQIPYAVTPCNDCADLSHPSVRVARGGGFDGGTDYARGGWSLGRTANDPTSRHNSQGFRCARAP